MILPPLIFCMSGLLLVSLETPPQEDMKKLPTVTIVTESTTSKVTDVIPSLVKRGIISVVTNKLLTESASLQQEVVKNLPLVTIVKKSTTSVVKGDTISVVRKEHLTELTKKLTDDNKIVSEVDSKNEILSQTIGHSRHEMSPGEQAEVTVVINALISGLDRSSFHLTEKVEDLNDIIKEMSEDNGKSIRTYRRYMNALTAVNSLMSFAVGSIEFFNVVSTFFMPSELSVILDNFDKLNNKINGVSDQINHIRNELDWSIEFNTWISTYINWELDIENGYTKLEDISRKLRETSNPTEKLKIMQIFVSYFENNQIESKTNKIFSLVTKDKTVTTVNLVETFAIKKKCDIKQLLKFKNIVQNAFMKSATQSAIYELIKHNNKDYVDIKLDNFYDMMYEIRLRFDKQEWSCYQNFKSQVSQLVNAIDYDNPSASIENFLKLVFNELSVKLDWFEWTVAVYDHTVDLKMYMLCNFRNNRIWRTCFQIIPKGNNYLQVNSVSGNNARNLIILWQAKFDNTYDYNNERNYTFVPFKLCDGCGSSDSVLSGSNMVTGIQTNDYIRNLIYSSHYCRHPGMNCNVADGYSILASINPQEPINPCLQNDICNHHGLCRHIPSTKQYICICDPYYDGDKCQTYVIPETSERIAAIISDLPEEFLRNGLPSVINVHLNLQNSIQELSNSRNINMKYFIEARTIIEQFKDYESGRMNTFNTESVGSEIDRIISGMKTVILDDGTLGNDNFFTVFMKSISYGTKINFACTKDYNNQVIKFQENILSIDTTLTGIKVNIYRRQSRQGFAISILSALEASRLRKEAYQQHWQIKSCPKLDVDDPQKSFCNLGYSYENLKVSLNCIGAYYPRPSSMNCAKTNTGQLQWISTFNCHYRWGRWSPYSECSKTCGGGIITRRRSKVDGTQETQRRECNTQECCEERDGKHKCPDRKCINLNQLCDGDADCTDGSDELISRCSYLRSGDQIGMINPDTNGYLQCFPFSRYWEDCNTGTYPAPLMSNVKLWDDSVLRIIGVNKKNYDPIKYGDLIGIASYGYNMVSCLGKDWDCTIRNDCGGAPGHCPTETFKIYSAERRGLCSLDVKVASNCKGKPIYPNDYVFLLHGGPDNTERNFWLSARGVGYDVRNMKCDSPSPLSHGNCLRQRWRMIRKG